MRLPIRNLDCSGRFAPAVLFLFVFIAWQAIAGETVTFHLQTGERIAGAVISQNTNQVVVSNQWASALAIPLDQISRRETNLVSAAVVIAQTTATNPPVAPAPKPASSTATNTASKSVTSAKAPAKSASPKHWKGQLDIGIDLLYGQKDRQLYYGRGKLTYARPYTSDPKKFFRSTFEYTAEYGRTQTEFRERVGTNFVTRTRDDVSANRMEGSWKLDFDVGKKFFVYNLFSAGYDEVRKIDLRYDLGPGVGYHLFSRSNFVMNVESGINYQVQDRTPPAEDVENFYFRFAEDITWKLPFSYNGLPSPTLTEKLEFFPQVDNLKEYRMRFESKLAFPLLKNITFNFSVIDLYDTKPAQNVSRNELQVRSSIGVTF